MSGDPRGAGAALADAALATCFPSLVGLVSASAHPRVTGLNVRIDFLHGRSFHAELRADLLEASILDAKQAEVASGAEGECAVLISGDKLQHGDHSRADARRFTFEIAPPHRSEPFIDATKHGFGR